MSDNLQVCKLIIYKYVYKLIYLQFTSWLSWKYMKPFLKKLLWFQNCCFCWGESRHHKYQFTSGLQVDSFGFSSVKRYTQTATYFLACLVDQQYSHTSLDYVITNCFFVNVNVQILLNIFDIYWRLQHKYKNIKLFVETGVVCIIKYFRLILRNFCNKIFP